MPDSLISQFQREYGQPIETFRTVNSSTQRNAISMLRRWEGMLVYVISEGVTYELKGGIDNTDWTPLGGLSDAPLDGQTYARKDGAWININSEKSLIYINGYATIKGFNNNGVGFQIGDTIIYRNPTTKVRAEYYVLNPTLTLPADFSNRAKLDMYNAAKPAI